MTDFARNLDTYNDVEDEAPEQPRCACGAWLPWKHTHTQQPVAGVTNFVWRCRKCGADNALVEDVAIEAQPPLAEDVPF